MVVRPIHGSLCEHRCLIPPVLLIHKLVQSSFKTPQCLSTNNMIRYLLSLFHSPTTLLENQFCKITIKLDTSRLPWILAHARMSLGVVALVRRPIVSSVMSMGSLLAWMTLLAATWTWTVWRWVTARTGWTWAKLSPYAASSRMPCFILLLCSRWVRTWWYLLLAWECISRGCSVCRFFSLYEFLVFKSISTLWNWCCTLVIISSAASNLLLMR